MAVSDRAITCTELLGKKAFRTRHVMKSKKRSLAAQFIGGFGRAGDPVQFISVEPSAREKARRHARIHGGRVYRAVAVGRAIASNRAIDLGWGYIVANEPPREFVFWRRCYAKIMELKHMSNADRQQYIYARGFEVFEDRSKYRRWMQYPARSLGNKTPASLLKRYRERKRYWSFLNELNTVYICDARTSSDS